MALADPWRACGIGGVATNYLPLASSSIVTVIATSECKSNQSARMPKKPAAQKTP
jgi:hypothetical protein